MTSTIAGVEPPPAEAVALSAVRELKSGALRQYSATTFPGGAWDGCAFAIRRAAKIGLLKPSRSDVPSYALLDVLDDDGDILVSYDIPTAQAFRYWKRTMRWVVIPAGQ